MPSEKCVETLESFEDEGFSCDLDRKDKARLAACVATSLREKKGLEFGESMREAWKMVKERCP
jgi:hypothetical protein